MDENEPAGSRQELRAAIHRVALAEGWEATCESLESLERAAAAWRRRLRVDPARTSAVEESRDRYLLHGPPERRRA